METAAALKERLRLLTKEMLSCAEAGEWEQLASLEQARHPLFAQVFSNGIAGNLELAQEVLAIDQKTTNLAEVGKQQIQEQLLSLRKSDKASNSYKSVQTFTSGNR